MKHLKAFLIMAFFISSFQVLGDTTYLEGQRLEKGKDGTVDKKSFIVELVTEKSARIWKIIRCNLPENNHCYSYQIALREDKPGVWMFEIPGAKEIVRTPIFTAEKKFPPTEYIAKWNGLDGKACCTFQQSVEGTKTTWTQTRIENKERIITITDLAQIDKPTFEKMAASRKATPLL